MLVVDGGVEAEILGDPCAFVVAAGDANDAAAVNFSNLPHDTAGSTAGGGDDERVTFFGAAICIPKKAVSPSTPRNTVSETKGVLGTFWKERFADSSRMTYS